MGGGIQKSSSSSRIRSMFSSVMQSNSNTSLNVSMFKANLQTHLSNSRAGAGLEAEQEVLPPNCLTQMRIQAQTSQNMTNIFIFLQSLFMIFVIYQNTCL